MQYSNSRTSHHNSSWGEIVRKSNQCKEERLGLFRKTEKENEGIKKNKKEGDKCLGQRTESAEQFCGEPEEGKTMTEEQELYIDVSCFPRPKIPGNLTWWAFVHS